MPRLSQVNEGDAYVRRGRMWTAVGFEPYTRKDGTETELAVWRGHCTRCNSAFLVKTPAVLLLDSSGSFDTARCPACKNAKRAKTAKKVLM